MATFTFSWTLKKLSLKTNKVVDAAANQR